MNAIYYVISDSPLMSGLWFSWSSKHLKGLPTKILSEGNISVCDMFLTNTYLL